LALLARLRLRGMLREFARRGKQRCMEFESEIVAKHHAPLHPRHLGSRDNLFATSGSHRNSHGLHAKTRWPLVRDTHRAGNLGANEYVHQSGASFRLRRRSTALGKEGGLLARGDGAASAGFAQQCCLEVAKWRFEGRLDCESGGDSLFRPAAQYLLQLQRILAAAEPVQTEQETIRCWKTWISRSTYKGKYKDAVERSLLTLQALTYAASGGFVAAPTTSLPEKVGGIRNWDYRYCWLRDTTFSLLGLMHCGYTEEAQAWLNWLKVCARESRGVEDRVRHHGEARAQRVDG